MRSYEVLFIIKPDLDEDAVNAVVEKFTNLIQETEGTVEEVSRWGKKRLAYEIKKFREGIYVLILFQGTPATVRELDRVLRISDEVLRHLIVRREAA
ncbi:MAG: 30S ribosomal protein S6 [Thermoanaerobacterales bacterium 50_218]|nr:MAG: 30S ribosomal protein S6 [Thermoanaerobacterales bacterium 50_218]HAA89061.1 30S ribosomal protein S6 [Peptococcaceae bacterium]